jgi:hypothetical protein
MCLESACVKLSAMKRPFRRLAAFVTIAAFAFAQLAIPAHSCSLQQGQTTSAIDSEAPGNPSLDDVDAAKPLCIYHCQQGKQSLDKPQAPGITPVIAMGYTRALADAHRVASPAPWIPRLHFLARESEPPLSIRNCCLRI